MTREATNPSANRPLESPRRRLLVAVDVDGTLIDSEYEDQLRPREIEAIVAARAAGHIVALCTGRNSRSVARLLEAGDGRLRDLPLILLNGAVVVGGEPRRRLVHRTLAADTVRRLVEIFRAHGALPMIYDSDDRGGVLIHDDREANSVLARYLQRRRETVGAIDVVADVLAHVPADALEVGTIDRAPIVAAISAQVARELGDQVKVVNTASLLSREPFRWAEIYHRECGKGQGVLALAAAHAIPRADIVGMGDNYNDLDLFAVAGHSVAMGNAPAEVKAAAHRVALPVGEGGAAAVLEEIAAGSWPPERGSAW